MLLCRGAIYGRGRVSALRRYQAGHRGPPLFAGFRHRRIPQAAQVRDMRFESYVSPAQCVSAVSSVCVILSATSPLLDLPPRHLCL
jgi:hypothetical protein